MVGRFVVMVDGGVTVVGDVLLGAAGMTGLACTVAHTYVQLFFRLLFSLFQGSVLCLPSDQFMSVY